MAEEGGASAESSGESKASEASLHVEYQSAIGRLDAYGDTGRRDLMFVTAAQAAIISIVGDRLASLDGVRDWALVGVAFAVALLGCNSQWRLMGQVGAFSSRARDIEQELSMKLLNDGNAVFALKDEKGDPLRTPRKWRSSSAPQSSRLVLRRLHPVSIGRTFIVLYFLFVAFWLYVAFSNWFGGTTP